MFAWRARVGLVKPTHRGKSFAFWYQHAPDGVEVVPTFIGFRRGAKDDFLDEGRLQRAEELATELRDVGCDIVVVSGSPPFLLRGLDFERRWREQLSQRLGILVVTGMEPHVLATRFLGARRVALATYFGPELNQAIVEYFRRLGMEGVVLPGFSLTGQGEDLYTTPLMALDDSSYRQVYRHCRQGLAGISGPVDALYINGGGWEVAPVIDTLERDLQVPVIWAMAAEMWQTYSLLGIRDEIPGCGRLLRGGVQGA